MKIIKLNHLIALLLSAMFILPVTAQENGEKKSSTQVNVYGEVFVGVGNIQNVGTPSGEICRKGGCHLGPLGADYTILHPRLPFGFGLTAYIRDPVYRETGGQNGVALNKALRSYLGPKISWDKFYNEHHSLHLSASAGWMNEYWKNQVPESSAYYKENDNLAGMITVSYGYLINDYSGIGLRVNLLTYGNSKGINTPNPLLDCLNIGMSYVVYGPW